jgi:hypothetical protein
MRQIGGLFQERDAHGGGRLSRIGKKENRFLQKRKQAKIAERPERKTDKSASVRLESE